MCYMRGRGPFTKIEDDKVGWKNQHKAGNKYQQSIYAENHLK